MKKTVIIFSLFLTAAWIFVASSCRQDEERYLPPTGWERTCEPFDSLTRRVELAFIASASNDSIERILKRFGQSLDMEGQRLDGDLRSELESRLLFWSSRLEARRGNVSGRKKKFETALASASPATAEYIRHRVVWLDENPGDYSKTEWYRHLLDEYSYLETRSDHIMLYCRARELMDLMRDIGYMSRAGHFLGLLDRWMEEQAKWIDLPGWVAHEQGSSLS